MRIGLILPRPPIFLAGFAPAAMRRVARQADGWLPGVRVASAPQP